MTDWARARTLTSDPTAAAEIADLLAAVRAEERARIGRWLRDHGRPALADLIEHGEHESGGQ